MSLFEKYHKEIVPSLQKKLGVKSPMAVPRIVKIVINIGLKEAKDLVDGAPKAIKENVAKEEAEAMKKKIEEAGGKAVLK